MTPLILLAVLAFLALLSFCVLVAPPDQVGRAAREAIGAIVALIICSLVFGAALSRLLDL